MKTHRNLSRLAGPGTLLLLSVCAGQAVGQSTSPAAGATAQPASQPASAPVTSAAPADPQIESFKSMLAGSWMASGKDPATGEGAEFWMHIAPVTIAGIDNALYVEQCRGDDPTTPYRQAVFQVYRNRGKLRMRTMEFRAPTPGGGPWGQMWLVPDLFPPVAPDALIATLDLEFSPSAGGFEGKTPYAYPNAANGAVEMTSEMKVAKDKLVTTDKGYGPDGKVVWSTSGDSDASNSLTWEHSDAGFKARRDEDGLVVLTLEEPTDGVRATDGDTMFLDYALWLADGTVIDSSSRRGQLLPLSIPPQEGRMIKGFNQGVADAPEGTIRRLIIPPALGWGDKERPQVPANSTLYFRVEVNTVQKPEPPPVEAEPGDQPPEGEEGGEKPAGGGH